MMISLTDHKKQKEKMLIPAMDGVRGLAIIIVLVSHMSFAGIFPHFIYSPMGVGKEGVAIFFMLSSFLLYRQWLYFDKTQILNIARWRDYFLRRIFRIYPAYLVILIIFLILGFLDVLNFNLYDVLEHLVLVEGARHLWSIPAEFQFYFILPVIVIVLHSYRLTALNRSFILIAGIFVLIAFHLFHRVTDNSIWVFSYLELFLSGMLLAEFELVSTQIVQSKRYTLSGDVLCLFAMIAALVTIPSIWSILSNRLVPFYKFHDDLWLYIIIGGGVMLSVLTRGRITCYFFESAVMRYIGRISFSLYLFHPLVLASVKRMRMEPFVSAFVFFSLSIIFAHLAYEIFEKPGMRVGKTVINKFSNRKIKFFNIFIRKKIPATGEDIHRD